ncbi:hypothetical protein BDZ91DRAFT_740719 [Kalaharituber pfeilii]|nr:hypothetical protein BDZ91DRAFT_740719 [Kalaharituber pfeilii]
MPSIAGHSQPLGPDMPLKPAHCSQSPPPDIPSGPNIPSKPVHHRSQHSKLKSNSVAEVLAVPTLAGGCYEFTATVVWSWWERAKNRGSLLKCLFGLADSNSLRLPPPLQTLSQGWKKLSFG